MPLPSLFIPHGAPDLPLADHPAKRFLQGLAARLPKPEAILVISAHWEAPRPTLGTAPRPETVYDFHGWPASLYTLRYPAATDPDLIDRVEARLIEAGVPAAQDPRRGYDHGVWVPLLLSWPEARIPVVQLSLIADGSAADHVALGRALAPLRQEGVLIIGSGAVTHNLRRLAPEGTPAPDWAVGFDAWLAERIAERDLEALTAFPAAPADAREAHPTPEHLLPLHVALGAGWEGGEARRVHRSFSYGSISMAAFAFGAEAELAFAEASR